MAHKLDFSKGKAAFVSYGAAAWHGLGEIMQDAISAQDALERGGLDFQVVKLPNIHYLPNGEELISDNSFFTCRLDTCKVLGDKLGKDYREFQNLECLNIADEILQAGKATIETAGAIDEGRKVFICLKVNTDIVIGSQDVVKQYVLIATSHDGSMAITATPTNVRVVCNNTLTAALRNAEGAIKIRHSDKAGGRLREATKVLGLMSHNTEVNAENYGIMKETHISKLDMMNYFGNIFCEKKEIALLQKGIPYEEALSAKRRVILENVVDFANVGVGQDMAFEGGKLNMWGAYNAVTGYVTRKKFSSVSDRADSLLFGSTAKLVHAAGVLAMEPEKIEPMQKKASSILTNFSLN